MNAPIRLRPAERADDPFLLGLFKTSRPEFQYIPLPPEQIEAIYQHQFGAQRASYNSVYPQAEHSVVLSGYTPAGMIWVDRGEVEHHLLDIAILPEFRNLGIGSELLRTLIAGAEAARKPVRCSVAVLNPGSLRFHLKRGFRVIGGDEIYQQLEYSVAEETCA